MAPVIPNADRPHPPAPGGEPGGRPAQSAPAAPDEHQPHAAPGGQHDRAAPGGQHAHGATAGYAPGQSRPLGGYAVLAATYSSAVAAGVTALRRSGRTLPERPNAGDIALVAVATHKLSRIVAKDKVMSFVRAPFTRYQEPSGQGEVEEEARGRGLQLALGELLVCPYCLSQWVATGLTLGLVAAPRTTRMACAVFVSYTLSDFLQVAYRAAEDAA